MLGTEGDTRRQSAFPKVMAWALSVLLVAIAYRGALWFLEVERSAGSRVTGPVDAGLTDWQANAKRFEAEKVQVASILSAAEKVEPFQIQPVMPSRGGLEDYPVVSRADPLGPEFGVRLAAILLDPKSYVSPGMDSKMCVFQPRVAFRVWKESSFVDVLICFDCLQLMVVESDPRVPERSLGAKMARFRVGGDFDPAARQVADLVRTAFPGNPSLEEMLGSTR